MEPILHLSLPVRDLTEARSFYVDVLDCGSGRDEPGWIDVWFHGMQITLHEEPQEVLPLERSGVRHFGVTLGREPFSALVGRLDAHPVTWVSPVATSYAGTPREQTKAKVADPSGNVIEVKTYADPASAFERPPPRPPPAPA